MKFYMRSLIAGNDGKSITGENLNVENGVDDIELRKWQMMLSLSRLITDDQMKLGST